MAKKFITVNTAMPDVYQMTRKLGVDKDGDVQSLVTSLAMRELTSFMPRTTGHLISTMSKKSTTRIRVSAPQARFLFFGVTKGGKQVDYSAQRNPKGGPNWDRRMVAERGAAIAAEVQRYVDGRRR